MSKQKVKIGLITQGNTIPAWAFALTKRIKQSDCAELKLVILNHYTKKKIRKNFMQELRFLLFYLHQFFEKIVFKPKPDAFKKYHISNLEGFDLTEFNQEKETTRALQQKRESILSKGIDVLIALDPYTPDDLLASLSKFGIWSVDTSSAQQTAIPNAAVLEVLLQSPVTDLFLTIHNKQTTISFKASFATIKNSTRWNRNFYYWKATCIIQTKLEQLYKLGWEKLVSTSEETQDKACMAAPGNLAMLTKSTKVFWSYLAGKTRDLLFREQWTILFSFQNNKINSLKGFHRITPPKDRLWADPFVIKKKNKYYIFAEEMDFRKQKGKIIVKEIDKSGVPVKTTIVLEQNHHLSYPYLFEDDGKLYMMPETSQKRTIELYKCENFPNDWTFVKTILTDLEAADASLLKHKDTYWLFTNVRMHKGVSINDDLFLFFAKDLCGDEWTPHPMNPIVSDVRFSRPAGQIAVRDNKLIRPAQDCSKRYGYAVHLMEIEEISETEYRERHVKTFFPDWETDVLGTHTFNKANGITVADALIRRKKFG